MDAALWAAEFTRLFENQKEKIDFNLMLGWFTDAIVCGYDNARWQYEKRTAEENLTAQEPCGPGQKETETNGS
jgi:hypothetical protein